MANNQLTELPKEIAQLTSIRILYLGDKQLARLLDGKSSRIQIHVYIKHVLN